MLTITPKYLNPTDLITPWMECDGGDKVDVLKAAEALPAGYVPQADGLVHGGGE